MSFAVRILENDQLAWRKLASNERPEGDEFRVDYVDENYVLGDDRVSVRPINSADRVNQRYDELSSIVDSERTRRIAKGFTFEGNQFDTDDTSLRNLTATVSLLGVGSSLPDGFTWRSADNQNIPMDAAKLLSFGGQILNWVNSNYVASWTIKAELKTIRDHPTYMDDFKLEELDDYDILTNNNWPG